MRRAALLVAASIALSSCGVDERLTEPGTIVGYYNVGTHDLFLRCLSTGSPTIVYLHGMGGTHESAGSIPDGFAGRERFCVYDRTNVWNSDAVTDRQTGSESVRQLNALLDAAEVPAPYVLVGASWGGLLATMYAATYPDEVRGLVLLDAILPTEDQLDALIPENERAEVVAAYDHNPERFDVNDAMLQAQDMMPAVPDIPMTYLSAQQGAGFPEQWPAEEMAALLAELLGEFVAAFPQGRSVAVDAPHSMESVIPDQIIDEIGGVVAAAAR